MKNQHHSHYVSNQQVIHRCLETYREMFNNMPFQWYVQNVYDSVNRKGYNIKHKEVEDTVKYFMGWSDREVCPYCRGKWQ